MGSRTRKSNVTNSVNDVFDYWHSNVQKRPTACKPLLPSRAPDLPMARKDLKKHSYENVIGVLRNKPHVLAKHMHKDKDNTGSDNVNVVIVSSKKQESCVELEDLKSTKEINRVDGEKIDGLFITYIKNENIEKVIELLKEYPMLHLYLYVDPLGVSALEYAVAMESVQMLDILLDNSPYNDEKLDMIIHAINISIIYNKSKIARHLLEKKNKMRILEESGEHKTAADIQMRSCTGTLQASTSRFEDARFHAGISPIMLAAQLGKNEIVSLLIQSGECDIHPVTAPCNHPSSCTMYSCKRSSAGIMNLEESLALVQTYRALSSPSFILNAGIEDPVQEAFKITVDMEALCVEDPAFKAEYKEIAQDCRQFAYDMASLCRTSDELDSFLQKTTEDVPNDVLCCKRLAHGRIQMAMSYKQKEFVTHPHVQKYLQKSWYDGCPQFVLRKLTKRRKLFFGLLFLLCYPILSLIYITQACPVVNKLMKSAVLKFLSHLMSYLMFLALLVALTISTKGWQKRTSDCDEILFWLVAVWVFGFTLRHFKLFFSRSDHRCRCEYGFDVLRWRFYDTLMIVFFIAALVLHGVCMYSHSVDSDEGLFMVCPIYAAACFLAFLRVFSFLKASASLGPLYISLKSMTVDIFRFSALVFIFMSANIIAALHLHRGYQYHVTRSMQTPNQNVSALTLPMINFMDVKFASYFWATFGPEERTDLDVTIGNSTMNGTIIEFHNFFARSLLYGYYICVPIVLLNMLIAMMANSYAKIKANSDMEWKFAWSRLQMTFFNDMGVLPPPLNAIPIPHFIKLFKAARHKKTVQKRKGSLRNEVLYERLSKRYWSERGTGINKVQ